MLKLHNLLLYVTVAAVVAVSSSSGKLVVEVLVVVDPHSVAKWTPHAERAGNTVDEEARALMNGAAKLYEDFNIDLKLKYGKIIYTDHDIVPMSQTYNEDWVSSKGALKTFREWAAKSGYEYDVALFLTGHDLSNGADSGINGEAYDWGTCTEYGAGIVENTLDERQVVCIAHEIAHSLGVNHDSHPDSYGCKDDDGYIMTSTTSALDAKFDKWSTCTRRYIDAFVANKQSKCLQETSADSTAFGNRIIGEITTADETCRRRLGLGSSANRFSYINENNNFHVCKAMACNEKVGASAHNVFVDISWFFFVPDGMPCGEGRRCNRGECVRDGSAHLVDGCLQPDDAPFFGESEWPSCYEAAMNGGCDNKDVREACCHACKFV